jgi:hypothetical protein
MNSHCNEMVYQTCIDHNVPSLEQAILTHPTTARAIKDHSGASAASLHSSTDPCPLAFAHPHNDECTCHQSSLSSELRSLTIVLAHA